MNFTLDDPSTGAVFTGLNESSLLLQQNGSEIWNNVTMPIFLVGNVFTYNFDYNAISSSITSVTLVLFATDNSGNLGQSASIVLLFDRNAPVLLDLIPNNNSYAYGTNFIVALNVTDFESGLELSNANITFNSNMFPLVFDTNTSLLARAFDFSNLQSNVILTFEVADLAGNTFTDSIPIKSTELGANKLFPFA